MNVTVIGAGNMGLALTAYIAINHKANVTLFTEKNINSIYLRMAEKDSLEKAEDFNTTSDAKKALSNADIVLVTYPAFLRKNFIQNNQQYFKAGSFLGFIPGYGGAEYTCTSLINRGVNIFGLQRVPYVARYSKGEHGYIAGILSSKKELFLCAIPRNKCEEIANYIQQLLDIPVKQLKEYLSITLAPSNPLLHITGIYNVFKDFEAGKKYERPMKFYEEWNDTASEILFRYDAELQDICSHLKPLDMSEVVPLPVYYESPTPQDMTKKLKSIESFNSVMVPLIHDKDGYVPDLTSRMFLEDYPFGVCIIKDFARMTGVSTPTVDLLLEFYEKLSGHKYFHSSGTYTEEIKDTGVPGINGFSNIKDIIDFYHS